MLLVFLNVEFLYKFWIVCAILLPTCSKDINLSRCTEKVNVYPCTYVSSYNICKYKSIISSWPYTNLGWNILCIYSEFYFSKQHSASNSYLKLAINMYYSLLLEKIIKRWIICLKKVRINFLNINLYLEDYKCLKLFILRTHWDVWGTYYCNSVLLCLIIYRLSSSFSLSSVCPQLWGYTSSKWFAEKTTRSNFVRRSDRNSWDNSAIESTIKPFWAKNIRYILLVHGLCSSRDVELWLVVSHMRTYRVWVLRLVILV